MTVENSDWRNRPTEISEITLDQNISHVIFADENGHADMNEVIQKFRSGEAIDDGSKYFALTTALFKIADLERVRQDTLAIKSKFWPPNGCFEYRKGGVMKVTFHSREIRNRKEAFADKVINYDDFILDLSKSLKDFETIITSAFINKHELFRRYGHSSYDSYELAVTFVMERLVCFQIKHNESAIIILENRGKREDKQILQAIMKLINYGNAYVRSSEFARIKGVYFNPKRPDLEPDKSYFGLEIADLYSYPIYKHCRSGTRDKAFEITELKIYGYPKYLTKGLKIFP